MADQYIVRIPYLQHLKSKIVSLNVVYSTNLLITAEVRMRSKFFSQPTLKMG